jgi:hypothetical protein
MKMTLIWIALTNCELRLCKRTHKPPSQLAALLRVAQIVYILSIGAPIIISVHSRTRFHSTNWLIKRVTHHCCHWLPTHSSQAGAYLVRQT